MSILRRWVWPGCKFLVFAVIALALVSIAFFPVAPVEEDVAGGPSGRERDPVVTVEKGTIRNDVEVDGTVVAVPTSPVKSTAEGTVTSVFVAAGDPVEAGQRIVQVRTETPATPPTDPELPTPKPTIQYHDVVTSAAGTLSALELIRGQQVAIGDAVGTVAPARFRVRADLGAAELYRLLQRPTEGTVTIPGGPAPFTCSNLRIGDDPTRAGADEDQPDTGTETTGMTCDVPGEVPVFAGLKTTVVVAAGAAEDVLTVPTTAVDGSAAAGTVTVVGKKGARETRAVTLGLRDGEWVEVTGGLAEGDSVLAFVPGADAPEDDDEALGGTVVVG